jgi:hypothetical protein
MTNRGNSRGYNNQQVIWQINTPKVDSIRWIRAKTDSDDNDNIWKTLPSPVGGSRNWSGVISDNIDFGLFFYTIRWTKDGVDHDHDPLIYIKPSTSRDTFSLASAITTTAVTLISALGLAKFIDWRMKRMEERLKKGQHQ